MTTTRPVIVFLGPTMPPALAAAQLPALYLPPCRMGDIYQAVRDLDPAAIGIVDGYFESTPAVWHKEIMYALSRGIPVWGASSMGALRAAELAPFGMQGVGAIFDDFASGRLTDDDEVAVVHGAAQDGYRLLSDPMVNLRHGLAAAERAGILTATARRTAVAALKSVYYPDRAWSLLWDDGIPHGLTPQQQQALRRFVEAGDFDLKRADARLLLGKLADWLADGCPPHQPDFELEPTIFWDHMRDLCDQAAAVTADSIASNGRMLEHLRIAYPDRDRVLRDALADRLIAREADRAGLPEPDDRTALRRFRQDRGLTTAAALAGWMKANGVTDQDCLRLARAEAQARMLARRAMPDVLKRIPDVLRRTGEFPALRAEADQVARTLEHMGIGEAGIDHVPDVGAVLDWYQARQGAVHQPLDHHIAELGFGNRAQFTRALVASYLAAKSAANDAANDAANATANDREAACDQTRH